MIGARPLTDNEVRRVLEEGFTGQFNHRNRSFFAIGVSTGFRASELLSLNMRDVMLRKYPKDYIKIPRRATKGAGTGRTMKLHKFAKDALQPWLDERLEETETQDLLDEPVFLSREKDTRTRQIRRITMQHSNIMLKKAFHRVGVYDSVSTHSLRKTFAKKAYEDAVRRFREGTVMIEPLMVVQKQLGHNMIQSTLSYLSFIGSDTDPKLFEFRKQD